MINRRKTKKIKIKDLFIGGFAPIVVQSMTNTPTKDVQKTLEQIERLEQAGCELVRLGIPDMASAKAVGDIIKGTSLPVCADIHFDVRLAYECLRQGVHKLRINPGNIENKDEVKRLAETAGEKGVPIRIGVNAGSLDKELLKKYGKPTPHALAESAEREISLLEEVGFKDILISVKASSVPLCVESYRLVSRKYDYPLHIGITEAGLLMEGTIRSSIGLGILLYEGIGDTLRVSLTHDPVREVEVAWEILKGLEIRKRGAVLHSCPTCARCEIDLISLAKRVGEEIKQIPYPISVAVMGCVVNGPGEARDKDVGIAGGKGKGVIFRHGEKIRTVSEEEMFSSLMMEINMVLMEKGFVSNDGNPTPRQTPVKASSLTGICKDSPVSVEDFMKEKHEDNERDEARLENKQN